jgi:hypothetical protein
MGIHEAKVIEIDKEHFLVLNTGNGDFDIPLTKDEPNIVKSVFNALLVELKKGLISFEIKVEEDGDIFYHVAKEYIAQLNSELEQIHGELIEHGLAKKEP